MRLQAIIFIEDNAKWRFTPDELPHSLTVTLLQRNMLGRGFDLRQTDVIIQVRSAVWHHNFALVTLRRDPSSAVPRSLIMLSGFPKIAMRNRADHKYGSRTTNETFSGDFHLSLLSIAFLHHLLSRTRGTARGG